VLCQKDEAQCRLPNAGFQNALSGKDKGPPRNTVAEDIWSFNSMCETFATFLQALVFVLGRLLGRPWDRVGSVSAQSQTLRASLARWPSRT
jgi:hypothetical protein